MGRIAASYLAGIMMICGLAGAAGAQEAPAITELPPAVLPDAAGALLPNEGGGLLLDENGQPLPSARSRQLLDENGEPLPELLELTEDHVAGAISLFEFLAARSFAPEERAAVEAQIEAEFTQAPLEAAVSVTGYLDMQQRIDRLAHPVAQAVARDEMLPVIYCSLSRREDEGSVFWLNLLFADNAVLGADCEQHYLVTERGFAAYLAASDVVARLGRVPPLDEAARQRARQAVRDDFAAIPPLERHLLGLAGSRLEILRTVLVALPAEQLDAWAHQIHDQHRHGMTTAEITRRAAAQATSELNAQKNDADVAALAQLTEQLNQIYAFNGAIRHYLTEIAWLL